MRMSVPAYISLGIATALVGFTFALNPDPGFLLTALPMLAVLVAVPLLLNTMNRRQAARVDMQSYKLYKIRDLAQLQAGDPVRLRGAVEKTSLKWLNRPRFQISDGTGDVSVLMFAAPPEEIKLGDKVETAGSLRFFGFSKERTVWGVKLQKI
ncbi:MAG: hypothetical protein PHC60_05000 [Heliobacteriaceae bacterium]|nr:hypothetical protein [Heliobacteriaceae bacterium]MDD4587727.1 hypothetical protein [Heliobacteriaceae bacterium]